MISDDNGDFSECLQDLKEVDKIYVAFELLCDNEHSQTCITNAMKNGSSIGGDNHIDEEPENFETLHKPLFVA